MTRVSATEFKNNIGTFSDAAMKEPVIITSHQRDRLVLLSAEEYQRLTATVAAQTDSLNDEMEARIKVTLETHKATILDLAQR